MIRKIKGEELKLSYSNYNFSHVEKKKEIVGQDKALGLLRLGLSINRPGYNIFLSGEVGTGRLTALKEEIKRIEDDTTNLFDVAYIYSANHISRPQCILLQPGKAKVLQNEINELRDKKRTKEEILISFPDEKIEHFLSSLPPYENNPEAWKINIVLDRSGVKRRPLVIETHPSHSSLFGYIEKETSPHLGVRVGSYQEASGGFLALNAEEIISNEELWTTLKRYLEMTNRAISSNAVQGEMLEGVRPYPIPVNTKIILLGDEEIYEKLIEKDELFFKYFKISPEFDYVMEKSKKNIEGTVSYLKQVGENLTKQDDSAYQEILRHSSWICEDRNKLTTQLSLLGDLLEEADLLTKENGKSIITKEEVNQALKRRNWFNSTQEEHINKEIKEGVMLMDLKGKKIGSANALAVMDRGLSSFGTPTVISATVAPGTEGIVNIEHEAGLSGGIHDKGLLILEGYLRHKYARSFPLSLYAGIAFEQSYGEIDGDSASSAELFALLSAIGEIPIKQSIAITGSVNQMGEMQPVGGVNEKIEGFFNACSTLGLTGEQGVIIPEKNINSLILPHEIEEAVNKNLFHIYSVSNIDDALELLSSLESGERDKKGIFPPRSFNRIVEDELKELYKCSQKQS